MRYLGTLDENKWIEDELDGYDVTKFKSYQEQEDGLPNHRKIAVLYYFINNNPVVGLGAREAEDLSVIKLPNPVTELETSKTLQFTSGPMLDVMNHLSQESGALVTLE